MKKLIIREMPKVEKPREKLILKGAQNLKDEEFLAILLEKKRKKLKYYMVDNSFFL